MPEQLEVRTKPRFIYWFAQTVVNIFLKLFFRLSYTGIENIPMEGGVIIAANHASFADPPSIGVTVPRELTFFAKKELFRIPLLSQFMTLANSIPVDRTGDSTATLKNVVKRLKAGWAVLVFPEGTRTKTGEFLKPKRGVGMMAVMADVPVVPCWIEGSFRCKIFLSRITLHFLPPFNPSEIEAVDKKEQYLLVSNRIMHHINNLYNSHHGRA